MRFNHLSMMGLLAFLGVMTIAFFSSALADTKTSQDKPATDNKPVAKLVFDPPWHDFGDVSDKQLLKHVFTFSVQGGPVHIDRLMAGCGCTTTKLTKRDYLPGETGEIEAHVDTTDFNGLIYKEIDVYINGQTDPSLQLGLTAKVHPKKIMTKPMK